MKNFSRMYRQNINIYKYFIETSRRNEGEYVIFSKFRETVSNLYSTKVAGFPCRGCIVDACCSSPCKKFGMWWESVLKDSFSKEKELKTKEEKYNNERLT